MHTCFNRNINGGRDVKFLECDYLLLHRCVKLTLIGSGRSASFLFFGKVSKFHFAVYCICNLGQLLMTFEISQGNSWWKKGYFVFKDRGISISRQTSLSKTWVNLSILATQGLMLSPPQRPKTLKNAKQNGVRAILMS